MSRENGSGGRRRIWRTLPVVSSELLVPLAQKAEADGVEGVFACRFTDLPLSPWRSPPAPPKA